MAISLELVGAERLAAGLANSRRTVAEEDLRAMTASLLLVEADARRNVRHDTRRLMNSITHRITTERGGLVGRVGPSLGYGLYVERGRPARKKAPPKAALRGWAARHGIPERAIFLIQRKIRLLGIPARPFLVPAYLRNTSRIARLFGDAADRIVVRVAGLD